MARPSKYTEKLGKELCAQLMEGMSLRAICAMEGMPTKTTICRWLADEEKYPEFCDQYARAREIQAELLAYEILDIADDESNDLVKILDKDGNNIGSQQNGVSVNRSRLRVDARKWTAARLLPKKYGDKITNEITGKDGGPIEAKTITADMDPKEASRRYKEWMGRHD